MQLAQWVGWAVLVSGALLAFKFLPPRTAALAVFSRPRGLVRHVSVLVSRFANVLAPTASSLQATQSPDELRELAIKATRYGLFLAWPMILVLVLRPDRIG